MTRESKLRVNLVLGFLSLSMLFVAGLKRNSDHSTEVSQKRQDLKPTTPSFCRAIDLSKPSRSIASGDDETQTEVDADLQTICENENRIANLKEELDQLQAKKEETLALIERVQKELEEKEEDDKDKKKKKIKVETEDQAMLLLLANRYSMMQNQANMANQMAMSLPAPIVEAYSPLHNRTSQQNMDYLQMALMHRINFSMQEDHYWHPEWNAQGHLTNPIYGTPNTWSNIESMYRDPVGSNVFQLPERMSSMPLYHAQPSYLF